MFWIVRNGAAAISRCANSNHFLRGLAPTNRMISSSTSRPESAPWVVNAPCSYEIGIMYEFYNLNKNETYSFYSDECFDVIKPCTTVGSSHGWLALYETSNHRLLLLNPITNRLVELPPADSVVHSLVIGEEKGHLAFITLGDGDSSRLAFFSRRRHCYEWIPFPVLKRKTKERLYDNIVYSSRHSRLFCLTEEKEGDNLELECWDFTDELGSPSVETMELHLDFPQGIDSAARKLKYIVCAEEEVYVVVRHAVRIKDLCRAYGTVGMDVYRIERESGRGKAVRMEDSLGGYAMFVGNNQPVAIRAEHANVKPNCIYFTSDNRLKEPVDKFEGGIFDYEKKVSLSLHTSEALYFGPLPIWYTPPLDSVSSGESVANRAMTGVSSGESSLILPPPVFTGGDWVLNRAVDSIFNLNKEIFGEIPDEDAEIVGYSQGWLALFNRRNNDLFLSDRLSQRCIKLPAIDALPDPYFNLDLDGHGSVSKLILSSSPDDEDCRALMSFGPAKRLAFCIPGRSSEWTPLGDIFHENPVPGCAMAFPMVHEDLVYRSRRKVFTSMPTCTLEIENYRVIDMRSYGLIDVREDRVGGGNLAQSYDWNIEDPASAKMVRTAEFVFRGNSEFRAGVEKGRTRIWLEENEEFLEKQCIHIPHLVYSEELDQLFVVLRFVMLMDPDGSGLPLGYIPRCEVKGLSDIFPCNTFGFIVLRIDEADNKHGEWNHCRILGDLNGMSMVVGMNNWVEISSPHLKPNCIYFSDAKRMRMVCGVNDSGIFDYENKIISPYSTLYDSPTSTLKIYDSPTPTFKTRNYPREIVCAPKFQIPFR